MARDRALVTRALAHFATVPVLTVLGATRRNRLPIFALVLRDRGGVVMHQNLVTRLLSDRFGIQARGGCACAGPYGHRLLGLGPAQGAAIRTAVLAGQEMARPGWTRLNLSWVMPTATVDHILTAVTRLAAEQATLAQGYLADPATAPYARAPLPQTA